ncbi:MAG TPA: polyprenyl diphosphate synthase [Candidatus Saccharimonadales bacterium]|nr:polyprenyl diphosphate synthase [Candidatus Saccharimonadales bacterium]
MSTEAVNQEKQNIPQHIAIIPDGNRRWAKEHGLPSLEGHRRGVENAEKLIYKARELGVKCITGWLFSTENWKRSADESSYLFNLAREFAKKYHQKFLDAKIRFKHIGRKDRIPQEVAKILAEMEESTKDFSEFTVCVAMDYGGHDELIRAVKKVNEASLEVTPENIENNLDTAGLPPPDLIIRTSGEQRLSGFLSWQSEYAEFLFPQVYFPDFGPDELEKAVVEYSNRDRRFGGNSKKQPV